MCEQVPEKDRMRRHVHENNGAREHVRRTIVYMCEHVCENRARESDRMGVVSSKPHVVETHTCWAKSDRDNNRQLKMRTWRCALQS